MRIRINVVPYASAYERLVGAYTSDLWVRIHMTCGCVYRGCVYSGVRIQECVYIWTCAYAILVGAYARLVGAYTYDLWVRIHMTCGCVYI